MKSFTSKAISTAATCFTALCVVFTSLSMTAPAAHAAPTHTTVIDRVSTNKSDFDKKQTPYFAITVKASSSKGGKGIPGKATLKVNGKALRSLKLKNGTVTFHVARKDLPNNRTATVGVRIHPQSPNRPEKVVLYKVKDVPKPKVSGGEKAVKIAKQQLGDRYKYGAEGPNAFDCSGLVRYAHKKATGRNVPHSSKAIRGKYKKIPWSKAEPGDVSYTPGHVDLVVDPDKRSVVGARTKDVTRGKALRGAIVLDLTP